MTRNVAPTPLLLLMVIFPRMSFHKKWFIFIKISILIPIFPAHFPFLFYFSLFFPLSHNHIYIYYILYILKIASRRNEIIDEQSAANENRSRWGRSPGVVFPTTIDVRGHPSFELPPNSCRCLILAVDRRHWDQKIFAWGNTQEVPRSSSAVVALF